jgi:hypothetical protein
VTPPTRLNTVGRWRGLLLFSPTVELNTCAFPVLRYPSGIGQRICPGPAAWLVKSITLRHDSAPHRDNRVRRNVIDTKYDFSCRTTPTSQSKGHDVKGHDVTFRYLLARGRLGAMDESSPGSS